MFQTILISLFCSSDTEDHKSTVKTVFSVIKSSHQKKSTTETHHRVSSDLYNTSKCTSKACEQKIILVSKTKNKLETMETDKIFDWGSKPTRSKLIFLSLHISRYGLKRAMIEKMSFKKFSRKRQMWPRQQAKIFIKFIG